MAESPTKTPGHGFANTTGSIPKRINQIYMHHHHPNPLAPLPGTKPTPRGLFLDLWGTLLEQPERGYVTSPDELRYHEGVLKSLFRASRYGWNIYLIGNEEAVWTGKVSLAAWKEIEARILTDLDGAGIVVTRTYVCLEHPEGIEGHVGDSVYHLPNTGSFYHAAHTDGIRLPKSWVIGDSTVELVSGWRAGLRMAGVRTGLGLSDRVFHVEPEFWGDDLSEVLLTLLENEGALLH